MISICQYDISGGVDGERPPNTRLHPTRFAPLRERVKRNVRPTTVSRKEIKVNAEQSLAFANAVFQGIPLVNRYMRERTMPLLEGLITPSDRDIRLTALYQRGFLWMQSLEKLSSPQDFQGIVTCNRALFELTIDMILLAEGGSIYTPERMYWWEQSAKLKGAEALVRYYNEIGQTVPGTYSHQVDFIHRKKSIVEHQRQALWNRTNHPQRWTGTSDLSIDAKKADELRSDEVAGNLDSSLLEFYETQMRRMHLSVHGSALAIERYLSREGFYVIAALGYKWATDLALFCTKLILSDFGFSAHLPELRNEWNQLKADRLLIFDQYRPDLSKDEEFEEETLPSDGV